MQIDPNHAVENSINRPYYPAFAEGNFVISKIRTRVYQKGIQKPYIPPETEICSPVIQAASSEARNTAAFAISSG